MTNEARLNTLKHDIQIGGYLLTGAKSILASRCNEFLGAWRLDVWVCSWDYWRYQIPALYVWIIKIYGIANSHFPGAFLRLNMRGHDLVILVDASTRLHPAMSCPANPQ